MDFAGRPQAGSITGYAAKTGTYTVVASDRGFVIDCTSGTFTVNLTAAATLGAAFSCTIYNSGSGIITVDPNASETLRTIAGTATTLGLSQGQGIIIVCDGANWDVFAATSPSLGVTTTDTAVAKFNGTRGTLQNTGVLINASNDVTIPSTTDSTSATTGALVVSGGAGIAGHVYAGNFFWSGKTGSGTGGNLRLIHDGGTLKWTIGILGGVGERGYAIYDNTNAAERIRIDGTTGAVIIGTDPGGSDLLRVGGALTINSATMIATKTSFTNGAGASTATLTNAPAATNPTKWIPVDDNGTTRYIPAW
jgi:hypothetical protein